MKRFLILMACVMMLAIAGGARASILNFEDLYPGGQDWGQIPSSYHGFTMASAYWQTSGYLPGTGYQNGTTGNVSMYTSGKTPITMSDGLFNFLGADITSAWDIGQDAYVQGWRGGTMVYQDYLTNLSYTGPLHYTTTFNNIDTLVFVPGLLGTNVFYPGFPGWNLDIDNIEYSSVPLPPASMLLGSGLLGLAGWRRFRKG